MIFYADLKLGDRGAAEACLKTILRLNQILCWAPVAARPTGTSHPVDHGETRSHERLDLGNRAISVKMRHLQELV